MFDEVLTFSSLKITVSDKFRRISFIQNPETSNNGSEFIKLLLHQRVAGPFFFFLLPTPHEWLLPVARNGNRDYTIYPAHLCTETIYSAGIFECASFDPVPNPT